jgi:hypothetical protein
VRCHVHKHFQVVPSTALASMTASLSEHVASVPIEKVFMSRPCSNTPAAALMPGDILDTLSCMCIEELCPRNLFFDTIYIRISY